MNAATIKSDDDSATMIAAFRAQLRDPAEPLSLLVVFNVKDVDAAAVEAAFARARSLTLGEPGCRVYNLHRDPRDRGRFVVYEQWRSLADLDAHFRKEYFARLRAEFNDVILGTPEFQVLLPTA